MSPSLAPFIGRVQELKSLKDLSQKKVSSLVVIQGRRRIGKSCLVEEFAKGSRFLEFTGLAPTESTTAQSERDEFAAQLARNTDLPVLKTDDWANLFILLAKETQTGRVIILLDEISWMGSKDPDFLGKLKTAWDGLFKKNPKLMMILCGSVSIWIEENILQGTAFMGRPSLILELRELSVPECNGLLNALGFRGSAYEKLKILCVTGGIPRYLEEIKSDRLADENIKDLCFSREGVLFREFKAIFGDIFQKRTETYQKIVGTLVDGAKEFSQIAECLNMDPNGHLTEYLNVLIKSGFIKRDRTWNFKEASDSALSQYRLSDNYLRFYLKYIGPNESKIENDMFRNRALSSIPGLSSVMGLQFENLVLNNRHFIWQKLNIYPEEITLDNPYFQRPGLRKKGCQIDYLIQVRTVLYVCEIKFSVDSLGLSIIEEMKQKINSIALPRGFSVMPVLIHVSGVAESVLESNYFSHVINFSELLN